MKKGLIAASTIVSCLVLLPGCSAINKGISGLNKLFQTPTIPVSQLKPARESSAQNIHRIAVIHDKRNLSGGSILETNLTGIKLHNSPYFTLVERSAIDNIIKEQTLNDGMLTDSATRIRLGKLTGADTLLSANYSSKVDSNRYKEERSKCVEKGDDWYKCKRSKTYNVSCTKKTAMVVLEPKAVSVESGRILFSRNYSEMTEASVCDDSNKALPTDEQLKGRAIAKVASELKADLAPFTITTDVKLMESDNSKMSNDAEKLFDMGIDFAHEKMYKNACQMFTKAQSAFADSLAITYNNAVCAEFVADIEMAEAFYTKATTMTDDIDKLKLIMDGDSRIAGRLKDMQVISSLSQSRL